MGRDTFRQPTETGLAWRAVVHDLGMPLATRNLKSCPVPKGGRGQRISQLLACDCDSTPLIEMHAGWAIDGPTRVNLARIADRFVVSCDGDQGCAKKASVSPPSSFRIGCALRVLSGQWDAAAEARRLMLLIQRNRKATRWRESSGSTAESGND
jgi:hypothetical protein